MYRARHHVHLLVDFLHSLLLLSLLFFFFSQVLGFSFCFFHGFVALFVHFNDCDDEHSNVTNAYECTVAICILYWSISHASLQAVVMSQRNLEIIKTPFSVDKMQIIFNKRGYFSGFQLGNTKITRRCNFKYHFALL